MSFTAVVHITGFNECPENAVKSVVSNVNHFSKLLIVFPGYDESNELYKDFEEDKAYLEEHDTEILVIPKLSIDYVENHSIVEIPAYCRFKPGGMEMIRRQIADAPNSVTHFAMSTVTALPDFSLFYGFLMLVEVINWIRSRITERGRLYQYNDVRIRHVVQCGKRRYLPERQFIWRFWNNGCAWRLYGGDAAVMMPPNDRTGYDYVMWTLYTNTTMGFSAWLFVFMGVWLSLLLPAYGLVVKWNIDSMWILGAWFAEILFSALVAQNYLKLKMGVLFSVFFPVYWMLFPFTLVYAKNLVPQKTWTN